MQFKEISPHDLSINPMAMVSKEWMLITAGDQNRGYNTMTASWGHFGALWGHSSGLPTSVIFVRPQRYTKQFVDREPLYSLCFFPEEYKKALGYLGTHSGRDSDKVAEAGLTPVFGDGYTYFEEAKLVFICRKLYQAPILEEGFHDKALMDDCYPKKDFHDLYIGEIVKVLVKE